MLAQGIVQICIPPLFPAYYALKCMLRGIMYMSNTTTHGYPQIDYVCSINCPPKLIESSDALFRGCDSRR
jgi:hypothetical protein